MLNTLKMPHKNCFIDLQNIHMFHLFQGNIQKVSDSKDYEHFWFQKWPFNSKSIIGKIFRSVAFDVFSKWRVPNGQQDSEKSSNIAKICGK